MTFTVTYRGADGAVRTEAVEAASRMDCLAQMRARGISPMGVKEEEAKRARKPGSGPMDGQKVRFPDRPIVACVLSVALIASIGGVWCWLTHGKAERLPHTEAPTKKTALHKAANPAEAKPVKAAATVVTNAPVADKAPEILPEMYMGKRVIKRVETTNAIGRVKAVLTTEDGLTHRVYVDVPGNDRIILKHGTDHVLAAVLGTPSGTDAPPVPLDEGMEAEFLESLKEPIENLETDTPEERRIKELVRQGREDMKTLMDQGMSFRQVILEHQARAKENSTIRLKIIQEAARIRDRYGEEEETKYRTTMNAALERMGIMPVGDGKTRVRRGANPEQ